MRANYEICPKCNKKGLHSNKGRNSALDNAIMPSFAFECKYCDYHESYKDNIERNGEYNKIK